MFSYPIGTITPNTKLGQIYGLSAFWPKFFAETASVEALMGSAAYEIGLLYSLLLQRCSTVSLQSTQVYENKEISLIVTSPTAPVAPANLVSAKYIVDRPYLPTVILEGGVHFEIEANGAIVFYENISSFPFATRNTLTGQEVSFWAVDAVFDNQWLAGNYGRMLGQSSTDSSSQTLQTFLESNLFFLVNGPNIAIIESGLQLSLGLPLAQYNETVLTTYTAGGQYIVITDQTSYSIPDTYNLSIKPGTTLTVGQPLFPSAASVVDAQIQDKWWIGFALPAQIMPNPPLPPIALNGNWVDVLMETYLKNHTFLLQFTPEAVNAAASPTELVFIIRQLIPTYTFPLTYYFIPFVDSLGATDSVSLAYAIDRCDTRPQISQFNRTSSAYTRGCPKFQRFDIPSQIWDRDFAGGSLQSSYPESGSSFQRTLFPMVPLGTASNLQQGAHDAVFATGTVTPTTSGDLIRITTSSPSASGNQNMFTPLIPLFMAKRSYLEQYVSLTGYQTTAAWGAVPPPSTPHYLNWYTPQTGYWINPTASLSSAPSGASFPKPNPELASSSALTSSSSILASFSTVSPAEIIEYADLAIFNVIDDLYAVYASFPLGVSQSSYALFGFRISDSDGVSAQTSGATPVYRGGAPGFANPWYCTRDRLGSTYTDALNSAVPATRAGFNLTHATV